MLLVKSAWIWTIQRNFILQFSIGWKAARDNVNQIAHVLKSRESLETTETWRLILRWRTCTHLSRKRGYFQHWLEYSSAFEVLEAREKLNIVPSHWETFENLRKCWPPLHESKLRLNTCCPVSWTLFMLDKLRYRKLIEPKTTWANQEHASCLLQWIISWTNGIKRKLKKHAKQGTVRMFKWLFNVTTRNVTVRNKTFIKCSYICRIC